MDFLLLQILLCLLIAGIIGAIIGWFLRGGCSKILKDCEEEWEAKVRSLEEDWTAQLKQANEETEHSKKMIVSLESEAREQASLKMDTEDDLDLMLSLEDKRDKTTTNEEKSPLEDMTASVLGRGDKIDKIRDEYGYNLQEIRGIRSSDAKILNQLGIRSTKDLKNLSSDKKGIEELSSKLNLPISEITSWISTADLLQISGLDVENAELIQAVGISSIRELIAVNTYSLHSKMAEFNENSPIVRDLPTIEQLKSWVELAKKLS